MKTTGLLLAGGKSSRMGTNKALLPMSEEINISKIAGEMELAVDETVIITNSPQDFSFLNLPMVEDEFKGMGPLGGLHAGLSASKTDVNVITACDMPFIKAALIKELLNHSTGFDAVVPEIEGQLHPLFAVYRKSTLPLLTACLKDHRLRMVAFLEEIHVKILKESDFRMYQENRDLFTYMFYNMNNPEEYARAKEIEKEITRI